MRCRIPSCSALRRLRKFAIRSSFVEMIFGVGAPAPSFPRTVPCADSPFPPQGRSGGYPCFFGTTSCYDSPPDFPLHFVVLRSAVPLASPAAADPTGSRRFLGNPLCTFAMLYDSVPFFALGREGRPGSGELPFAGLAGASFRPSIAGLAAFAARRCRPRGWVTRRHESCPTFEAPSHGFRTRCLRFARSLPTLRLSAHARLASGGWPTPSGGRAPTRFQSFHLHDFLLSRLSCRKPTLGRDSSLPSCCYRSALVRLRDVDGALAITAHRRADNEIVHAGWTDHDAFLLLEGSAMGIVRSPRG
jgi:hypothetical protein